MKRLFYVYFLTICLSLPNVTVCAIPNDVVVCDSLIAGSLKKLNGPVSIDVLLKVKGEMARISDICPDSWIPYYYQALLGIQTSLYSRSNKYGLMEESLKQIETAEKLDSVNFSELFALKAFYYYVLIAIDSKINGPKYYSSVFRECEKSLKINPKNPRALAISFVFKKQMANFLNVKDDEDQKELQSIIDIFDKEDKNTILPRWGKEVLLYLNY